ncbi:MAG: hypothetical protein BWY72_01768 [Bacteroidetes bacterium ADurb.Bin416]|nr:MAG: hypothetical protein BWY72_01768 [Bacteroidetes bacterium ADurb.Bin416]
MSIGFLVVGRKMLDCGPHPVRLYPFYVGGCCFPGKQWIFRIILEITPTQRISVQIHTRCQQYVNAIFQHFLSDGSSHFLNEVHIPA